MKFARKKPTYLQRRRGEWRYLISTVDFVWDLSSVRVLSNRYSAVMLGFTVAYCYTYKESIAER